MNGSSFFSRSMRVVRKIVKGAGILTIAQSPEQWNLQFKRGRWDRLISEQPNTELIGRMILEKARESGGKLHIADIGCGNGGLVRFLASHEELIDYMGIDISDTAISASRQTAPWAHFSLFDASIPPDDLGTFDVLVFNEVFYYLDTKRVLPRYVSHASDNAMIIISIVRSWRSFFLWRRIRAAITIQSSYRVRAKNGSHTAWDVGIGPFKIPSS